MRRTKAEAEETRQAIIAAAERVFFEKGVSNSTMDDVAAAAGVTRGAIYWHFTSKTDLFLALYRSVPLPQADMVDPDPAVSSRYDTLKSMERTVCDWIELFVRDEQRQRMLTILIRTNYGDGYESVRQAQEELDAYHTSNLKAVFERSLAEDRLAWTWTPDSASRSLRWLIKGMCTEWLLFGKQFDLAKEGVDSVRRLFDSFEKKTST
ncbi:TetR family transcriptional regulator [Rhizobium binxianense]